jgi:hypothetical protein
MEAAIAFKAKVEDWLTRRGMPLAESEAEVREMDYDLCASSMPFWINSLNEEGAFDMFAEEIECMVAHSEDGDIQRGAVIIRQQQWENSTVVRVLLQHRMKEPPVDKLEQATEQLRS